MHILSSYEYGTYLDLLGQRGSNDGRMDEGGKKRKEKMEVRWLLTNRKHGGKTKCVSVLKAALNKTKGWKETERRLLMIEREEETEEISKAR